MTLGFMKLTAQSSGARPTLMSLVLHTRHAFGDEETFAIAAEANARLADEKVDPAVMFKAVLLERHPEVQRAIDNEWREFAG